MQINILLYIILIVNFIHLFNIYLLLLFALIVYLIVLDFHIKLAYRYLIIANYYITMLLIVFMHSFNI